MCFSELEAYVKRHSSQVIRAANEINSSDVGSKNVDYCNIVELTDEETLRRSNFN
jgi:hypothetical protein